VEERIAALEAQVEELLGKIDVLEGVFDDVEELELLLAIIEDDEERADADDEDDWEVDEPTEPGATDA